MIRVVTLIPGRGHRGVDEARGVGFVGEFPGNALAGVWQGLGIADHRAGNHGAVLGLDLPSMSPDPVRRTPVDVLGKRLGHPVSMNVSEFVKIRRIHDVLIDVIAPYEHMGQSAEFLDLPGGSARTPEQVLHAQALHLFDEFRGIRLAAAHAPDVGRADKQIDVRITFPFFRERLVKAGLFGMRQIVFAHGHMPSAVEEHEAGLARVSELASLRIP